MSSPNKKAKQEMNENGAVLTINNYINGKFMDPTTGEYMDVKVSEYIFCLFVKVTRQKINFKNKQTNRPQQQEK